MLAQGRYPVARCWTRIYASFTGQIAAVVELEWCECGLGGRLLGAFDFCRAIDAKNRCVLWYQSRRVRTALAHKPGQTRPQESGILRNVTYRQGIRGDFVFFKTLTRRRNPVSQLGMRVAVQIFACPLAWQGSGKNGPGEIRGKVSARTRVLASTRRFRAHCVEHF